jgi:hypothetical protein
MQQFFDPLPKGRIGGTNLVQEGRALRWILLLQRLDEKGLFLHVGSVSAIGVSVSTSQCDFHPRTAHEIREKSWRRASLFAYPSLSPSSSRNQARAYAQI